MKRSAWIAAGLAVASFAYAAAGPHPAAASTQAAAINAEALLSSNTYPIGLEDGRLSGAGGDLILKLGEQAQFVAIGEEHNNPDVARFVTALFRALHERAGYEYLAVEQDPVTMRMISEPPLRGDLQAIRRQAGARKHSFTFSTDEELEMLASVGQISTGRARPIWGCEQAFGASHILERILPKAPSAEAGALAARLLAEARLRESARSQPIENRFLLDPQATAEMARLQQLYSPAADSETMFMVDALAKSFEIYNYYRRGEQGLIPGYYSNNAVREEHMKSLCRDEYLRALERDGRPPRAILKFGHWHLFQGTSPASLTSTTGNFFANVATLNDLGFVSIAFMSRLYDGEPLWKGEDSRSYVALAPVLEEPGWKLIDMRPLREYPAYRALLQSAGPDLTQAAKDNLRRLVYGFDFALVMDQSRRGHYTAGQLDRPKP